MLLIELIEPTVTVTLSLQNPGVQAPGYLDADRLNSRQYK